MKFEEPTSNTGISGKNKNDKPLYENKILYILKTSWSLRSSSFPILNDRISITTFLFYLSPIDFDMVCL